MAFLWRYLLGLAIATASEVRSRHRALLRAELSSSGEVVGSLTKQSNNTGIMLRLGKNSVMEVHDAEMAVLKMAHQLLHSFKEDGQDFEQQIWIRNLATHIEDSLEAGASAEDAKHMLLTFFLFQTPDGSIPDWFDSANGNVDKNTGATDQETSLIQAVYSYVKHTGDLDFMKHQVADIEQHTLISVQQRVELAFEFLLKERVSPEHGLLYGATTVDWADLQPSRMEDYHMGRNLYKFTSATHPAVDIYDNAMMILAMQDFVELCQQLKDDACVSKWGDSVAKWKQQARKVLWDDNRHKWRPHVYFSQWSNVTKDCQSGSPFPANFSEDDVYYHGGTAMAMLAGLNTKEEAKAAYEQMAQNAKQTGWPSATIGLSVYPSYPSDSFKAGTFHNAGDWPSWGGRAVQALVSMGLLDEARAALSPMLVRAINAGHFSEWYDEKNLEQGESDCKTAAGALAKAVRMLQDAEKGAGQSHVA